MASEWHWNRGWANGRALEFPTNAQGDCMHCDK